VAKTRMRDVVILLPGIMGSVLQKDGSDLWALSLDAALTVATNPFSGIKQLQLTHDDPDVEDLGDGVKATRLMRTAHLIPGFWKIDGYTGISRLIRERFDVVGGDVDGDSPANFYEFPYDWRRDNRVAARRLKRFIDQCLKGWREHSGAEDAKVILMAHSMGGLVARHYLEVLEGWKNCRALITFGTPYRGSVDALNYLANGYKKWWVVDLTDLLRSFTSVYQLLPIYQMIDVGGEYRRPAEVEGIEGVDKARAEQADAFHREIERAVEGNGKVDEYNEQGYKIVPVVGTRQPTLQSAKLEGGRLTVGREVPRLPWFQAELSDGDGTVPRASAIPIELSDAYRDTYRAERHGSLQNNLPVLDDLLERLTQMQVSHLRAIRGPEISMAAAGRAAISLDLDDLYLTGEPVSMRAKLINYTGGPGTLKAMLEPLSASGPQLEAQFTEVSDEWVFEIENVPPGLYRVEVRTDDASPQAPPSVHDIFQVAGDPSGAR
jgi:pimeloyl-ACP methyl ester carboxylesterase